MNEKNTEDLTKILKSTHLDEFTKYCKEQKAVLDNETEAFSIFIKERLREKGITQQTVFLRADISERYGYKLLSGERRTRHRDIILRICYSAELTLEETQTALKKYGLPMLYPKVTRDALLMIIFNERPGSIIDVNLYLKKNHMEVLRSCGMKD